MKPISEFLVGCTLAMMALMACAQAPSAPSHSSTVRVSHELNYDINVPDPVLAQTLQTQLPAPVHVPPIQAQTTWNFTAAYGAANVYYGPSAPPQGVYRGVGIVVAPLAVAGKETFLGFEWPQVTGGYPSTDEWVWAGRFVYTPVAPR